MRTVSFREGTSCDSSKLLESLILHYSHYVTLNAGGMRYETVDAHQLPNVVMNLGTFLTFKKKHVVNKFTITQMLHVWNIYLRVHLGHIYGINVGKYSSPMGHLEHRNPKPLGGSSPVELVIPYDVKRPQSCGNHPI